MTIDLTQPQCEAILTDHHYGHLGCLDGDEPYVVPITYVFKDGFLYGYTEEGQKVRNMRAHPKVCIQVEHVTDGQRWESVQCFGYFEEITDAKDIQQVKLLFGQAHGEHILEGGGTLISPVIAHLHLPDAMDGVSYRVKPYRIVGRTEKPRTE